MGMYQKRFFTTDSNSLVPLYKNDEIIIYSYQSKTLWFFISPNTTLMLIMFPSFLHDETNEFELVVKKSYLLYTRIMKIYLIILMKIRVLIKSSFSIGLNKTPNFH